MKPANIPDLLASKHLRRVFYCATALTVLLLIAVRLFVLPAVTDVAALSFANFLASLMDSAIVAILATVGLATMIFVLTPSVMERAELKIIPPHDIKELLRQGLVETQEWWFSGGTGRYTRAETVPELAQSARSTNATKVLHVQIIHPLERDTVSQYADYRNRVRTGKGEAAWTLHRVQRELYATILSIYYWQAMEPLLQIHIGLKNHYSLFRMDIFSSGLIITKEDPKEPALYCDSQSFFFSAYREDFRLSMEQAQKLPPLPPSLNLCELTPHLARTVFETLGVYDDELSDEDLTQIVASATSRNHPYA